MLPKLLFWLSALALPTSAALAQTKPKPAPPTAKRAATIQGLDPEQAPETTVITRADAITANMTEALGLSPAQIEKVRDINRNSVRIVETSKLNHSDEPAKLRDFIASVGMARLDQLKDVLTPAQFNKYQQKREQKMGIPTLRGVQGTPPPGLGSRGGD